MIRLFLSHASEDKEAFVEPLAIALRSDFEVWYDRYSLTLGDSLLGKISEGLSACDYGVVVLSPSFFSKRWPQTELDGLFALETTERKVILPIWMNVSEADVRDFSPILAGRLGVSTDVGLENVILEIKRAVGLADRIRDIGRSAWKAKFEAIDADLQHRRASEQRAKTVSGVEEVRLAARAIVLDARTRGKSLGESMASFTVEERHRGGTPDAESMTLHGPKRISLHLSFTAPVTNSVQHTKLQVGIFRDNDDFDDQGFQQILREDFDANYDHEFKIYWSNSTHTFSTGDALLDFFFEKFADAVERFVNHDEG